MKLMDLGTGNSRRQGDKEQTQSIPPIS
jgi:hypothetical protein